MTLKKLYAEIEKSEDLEDGTIKVWGWASTASVDSDGETITADAMKAALPDYMKFGAVREMHQAKAAGTAIEAEVKEDGRTWFGAHVVDSEAVKKVKTGVYKGFSVGGKVTDRDEMNKSVIKGIKLVEVSLVDRPANPDAVFTMYKAETLEEPIAPVSAIDQLAELLNKGEITPERLVELAALEKAEKPASPIFATLNKFMGEEAWDAARALDCLNSVFDLLYGEMGEAEENAEQIVALKAAIEALKAFIISELQEDNSDKVAKAGARFSKATKDALSIVHKAVKECSDHLDGIGYQDADEDKDEETEKSKSVEDLAKFSGELDLAKAALSKVEAERDDLKKQVKELQAQPAAGKALLKSMEKGQDLPASIATPTIQPVTNGDGDLNAAATLIKAIHSQQIRAS
jgi:phage head maturation protease